MSDDPEQNDTSQKPVKKSSSLDELCAEAARETIKEMNSNQSSSEQEAWMNGESDKESSDEETGEFHQHFDNWSKLTKVAKEVCAKYLSFRDLAYLRGMDLVVRDFLFSWKFFIESLDVHFRYGRIDTSIDGFPYVESFYEHNLKWLTSLRLTIENLNLSGVPPDIESAAAFMAQFKKTDVHNLDICLGSVEWFSRVVNSPSIGELHTLTLRNEGFDEQRNNERWMDDVLRSPLITRFKVIQLTEFTRIQAIRSLIEMWIEHPEGFVGMCLYAYAFIHGSFGDIPTLLRGVSVLGNNEYQLPTQNSAYHIQIKVMPDLGRDNALFAKLAHCSQTQIVEDLEEWFANANDEGSDQGYCWGDVKAEYEWYERSEYAKESDDGYAPPTEEEIEENIYKGYVEFFMGIIQDEEMFEGFAEFLEGLNI